MDHEDYIVDIHHKDILSVDFFMVKVGCTFYGYKVG